MAKRMFSLVTVVAALVAFTPLQTSVSAATSNYRIPFGFIANGVTLPAGTYSITTENGPLFLRGERTGVFLMTNYASGDKSRRGHLVFLKTGSRYDLAEIWTGDGVGRKVQKSRRQAEEQARAATVPVERIVIPLM